MTATALIKESDLKRMAKIAKTQGVTVWIEINGNRVGVTPDIPAIHSPQAVDLQPEDFTTLAEWQAWREQERVREAKRHS